MIKKARVVSCFIMSIILSVSLLSSSVEAESFSVEEDSMQSFRFFEPFGMFNPNHDFLDEGINSIVQLPSETKASITAKTVASQTVDSIGIAFILQRWTGSEWINVGTPVDRSTTNKDSYTASITWIVTSGYYYRAKTLHWV